MTLNFALCEREFSVISSMLGKNWLLFPNVERSFSSSVGRIGKFFGAFSTVLCCLNIVLTMRSSKEWNEITLIRPPHAINFKCLLKQIFNRCHSSFYRDTNRLENSFSRMSPFFVLQQLNTISMISTNSPVVYNTVLSADTLNISERFVSRTSLPHIDRRYELIRHSSIHFTISSAVNGALWSIRISSLHFDGN